MGALSGKVCIVTGAAGGIGGAITEIFAKNDASLVIADINEQAGKAIADKINKEKGCALFIKVDVTNPEDCSKMVDLAEKEFGRLDIAVNNVGGGERGNVKETHEYPAELWKKVLDVNISSVFYCLKYELPLMLKSGGSIINIASMMAFKRYPGTPAYTAAKSGVVALTELICNEYGARGIRCNSIAPGVIRTEANASLISSPQWKDKLEASIPAGTPGNPGDIAEAVLWLCSSSASYVNGCCLPLDGGALTRR